MSAPRLAARRLAALLFLPACHTWRPVELGPNTGFETDNRVRVETKGARGDSLVVSGNGSAGKSHARVVFHGASVEGDSLVGVRSGSAQPVAIADVRRAEERRFSARRTTGLVLGVVAGGFLALIVLVAASAGSPAY